ncbi:sodium bile acid symporter family protein [Apiospora arundinis]
MEENAKYRAETNVVPTTLSHPDDAMFLQHLEIAQKETTMAAYFGYSDVKDLRAFMCTPNALHIACVLHAIIPKELGNSQIREWIEKVYKLFKKCPSDADFQSKYDADDATVMELTNSRGHNMHPNGQIEEALAQVVVWACKRLETPAGETEPTWQDETYPQHVIKLLERGGAGKVVLPKVEWTGDIRPTVHHPGLDEPPFEKYHRIFVLARRVLLFVLRPSGFKKVFMKPYHTKMGTLPEDYRGDEKIQHGIFKNCHFQGHLKPVPQSDKPRWMVPNTLSPSDDSLIGPHDDDEADIASDLVEADYALQGDIEHDVDPQDGTAMAAQSDHTRVEPVAEQDIQQDVKPDVNQDVEQDVKPIAQRDAETRTHHETKVELSNHGLAPPPPSYDTAGNSNSEVAHTQGHSTQKRPFESFQDHEDIQIEHAGDAATSNSPKRARTDGPSSELERMPIPANRGPVTFESLLKDHYRERQSTLPQILESTARDYDKGCEAALLERFEPMRNRIETLEVCLHSKTTQIGTLKTEVTALEERLASESGEKAALQGKIQSQETQISRQAETLAEQNNRITSLEVKINDLQGEATVLKGKKAALEGEVVTLKEEKASLGKDNVALGRENQSLQERVAEAVAILDKAFSTVRGDGKSY